MKLFAIKTQGQMEQHYRDGETSVYTEQDVTRYENWEKSTLRQFQGKPEDPAKLRFVPGGEKRTARRMNENSSTSSHRVTFAEVEYI